MKIKFIMMASMAAFALTFTACSSNQKQSGTETAETQTSAVQTIDNLLAHADSKTIRVEAGELGSFDTKCVNSMVEVTGKLVEQRVDEAYLQKWEAQLKSQTAKAHGDGEAGCDSEKKARGETGNTPEERIADFRAKIAQRKADTGKDYLSFYYVEAQSYAIK